MNGTEYGKAIERLGLSQVGAAKLLGVNDRTSRRWIADEVPIPISVAVTLRLMIKKQIDIDYVQAITDREVARREKEEKTRTRIRGS